MIRIQTTGPNRNTINNVRKRFLATHAFTSSCFIFIYCSAAKMDAKKHVAYANPYNEIISSPLIYHSNVQSVLLPNPIEVVALL